ncbi:hypothetical protein [Sphingobium chlorophenolicum]|uniref:Putative K+ channel TrkA-N n=1 Tax=Sphingobium chlorophenolicum TaxID=46429 RepID=A0A081RCK2_SPHCR|nr:hypothetical protein [Sphingobium chlorophenolicum]KEQ52925.1 putative K+ channel TrkA-N [Sphingobium chlorophenolicum]
MSLTAQLLIATGAVAATVLVHLTGLAILLAAFGLLALHAVEIWLWRHCTGYWTSPPS